MNIFKVLKQDILKAISSINPTAQSTSQITVEMPRDGGNGDLSTNAAMVLVKELARVPKDIANDLKKELEKLDYIHSIDIAGPGFINFTIHKSYWQETVKDIIEAGANYGHNNIGKGVRVNVEYVSANPTGPMHIGHARGAVYGDALARLLQFCGYDVTKEYYINDAGSQIDTLVRSVLIRYKEALTGEIIDIPQGLYPGEYLKPVGENLVEKYGDTLLAKSEADVISIIKDFVVSEMLSLIKSDLLDLGIKHDVFTSENSLYTDGKVDIALEKLNKLGLVYVGALPPPKGKAPEDWEPVPLLLFKSTAFGDDQDRPIKKSNGGWTYFAGEVAYSYDKISRKFDAVVIVLGADHSGYVKRTKAVIDALSESKIISDIKLCQMVNYVENNEPIKMSKRAGTFTTVRDVTNELGKDIIRFIMLSRKNDIVLDFDLVKVKEQSKENPVFYVQYAYVRTQSILANAASQMQESYMIFKAHHYDTTLLDCSEEVELIKLLASWTKVVELAAIHFEPHRIAFYLQHVASAFHALWNLSQENNSYRFIVPDNPQLTAARLSLAQAVANVMSCGFNIIGIDAVERM